MSGTLTNFSDTGRKIPDTALAAAKVKLTGPDNLAATPANIIQLPEAAERIIDVRSTVTASGAAGAVLVPIEGTHYQLSGDGLSLTNPSGVDFSAETWLIEYERSAVAGGQSSVTP